MKKVLSIFVLLLAAGGLTMAQQVDVEDVDPAQLDFSQVDVSGIEFYFNGPLELYVTGVRYGDMVYSAILDYDGGQVVDIRAPRVATTEGKPMALDLSQVTVSLTNTGLELEGVIADGRLYRGAIRVTNDNDLQVAGIFRGDRVTAPMEDVRALESEISRLNRTIERRESRIERLTAQIEELPEEERVTQLRNQVQEVEKQLQQSQARADRLQQTVAQRESRIDQLQSTVDQRESRISGLESTLNRRESTLNRRESTIDDLQDQVAALERDLDNSEARIGTLQDRLADLRVGDWETAPERLDTVVLNGFSGGRIGMGTWQTSRVAVTQNDDEALFAKYIVPARQGSGELYYRFTGRALGSGRHGYGIHFLASGSESATGYGYGESYLVWVTQDEANYQNPSTYVQLYRSYDDVRMVELQSSMAEISIGGSNIIEVYVNRGSNLITVVVDDQAVLSYQPGSLIFQGSEVVARTLGSAVIRDLQIRTGR